MLITEVVAVQGCWSLYNKDEKIRIDDLRVDQVRTIVLAIPARKLADWFCCREGDVTWQTLSEISEFYEDVRAVKLDAQSAPSVCPVIARRPLFEDAPPEEMVTNSKLGIDSVEIAERRTARRYVRNLVLSLNHENKDYSCGTLDVSMSGMSLKENLPAGLGKTFRGELSLAGSKVKVLLGKVTDNKVKLLEADAWDVIRHWLINW